MNYIYKTFTFLVIFLVANLASFIAGTIGGIWLMQESEKTQSKFNGTER